MAEVYQSASTQYIPMNPEALKNSNEEEKRKKRIKWAIYISAFTVFQVMVILVFTLVVMKVKTPKFRMGGENFHIQTLTTNLSPPSFDIAFVAPLRLRNANFGPYKYDSTVVVFSYDGVKIGEAIIPKSKVNMKSTKKVDVLVSITSQAVVNNTKLVTELNSGFITVHSGGEMSGKVELMRLLKKKKTAIMDCSIRFNLTSENVQSLTCI